MKWVPQSREQLAAMRRRFPVHVPMVPLDINGPPSFGESVLLVKPFEGVAVVLSVGSGSCVVESWYSGEQLRVARSRVRRDFAAQAMRAAGYPAWRVTPAPKAWPGGPGRRGWCGR